MPIEVDVIEYRLGEPRPPIPEGWYVTYSENNGDTIIVHIARKVGQEKEDE